MSDPAQVPGSPSAQTETSTPRPSLLKLLQSVFLGLSVLGWVRLGQALAGWNLQVELLGRPLVYYLVLSGLLWGLLGLLVAGLLWRRSELAIPAAWAGSILFPLAFWLERFLLVRSPEDWSNWPFMLGLTLLWLLLAVVTLARRQTQAYLAKEETSK